MEAEGLSEQAVRDAVKAALCDVLGSSPDAQGLEEGRAYLRALSRGGWLVPSWPRPLGGLDATRAEAARIRKVLQELPAPDLYSFFVGLHMVAPTLLSHGTDDQQTRYLPSIANGKAIWCQMFSEPDAGSDLANVHTRAVQSDGGWTLTGQKIWTSRAYYADHGICLARTNPDLPKYKGMTMFIVSMQQKGVEVRPLRQMNGDDQFSEVFLTDVFVPDPDRIGDVGGGWGIAHTVLAHERSSIGLARRSNRPGRSTGSTHVPGWLRELKSMGFLETGARRDRAMRAYINAEVARLTAARAAAVGRAGRPPGPEGSGQKLRTSAVFKERAYLLKEANGARGMLTDHHGHDDAVTAPSMSIRGGTDEIQRNIVAERVLGLPAERPADRDGPWSQVQGSGV